MAYRNLEVGDDVKVRKYGSKDHGHFGKVSGIITDHRSEQIGVEVQDGDFVMGVFKPSELLVSNGNPYQMCLSQEDEDSFFHDEEVGDSEIMQQLLQRVAKIEKQIANIVYGKVA